MSLKDQAVTANTLEISEDAASGFWIGVRGADGKLLETDGPYTTRAGAETWGDRLLRSINGIQKALA